MCSPTNLLTSNYEWLCQLDVKITDHLAEMGKDGGKGSPLRFALKLMEWSMHGVVWLCVIGYFLYTTKNVKSIPLFMNILLALIFDLIIIGASKLMFRRRRPIHNVDDQYGEAPYVDQFSFPSGHSSRGAMMTKILFLLVAMETTTAYCVLIYPLALGVSRVMLGRHYLSDVIVGLLIGALEGDLVATFWLNDATCIEFAKIIRTIP